MLSPAKIGIVPGGSGSIEIAAVSSLNDALYAMVFQIICMVTQAKGKHL